VAGAIGVLAVANQEAQWILVFMAFFWIPMLLVAYAITRDPSPDRPPADLAPGDDDLMTRTRAAAAATMMSRGALSAILVSVAAAAVAFRALVFHNLYQTAGLFIGLSLLIGLVVILMVSPQTTTGVLCKGITVALCISCSSSVRASCALRCQLRSSMASGCWLAVPRTPSPGAGATKTDRAARCSPASW
jgi:hypothetical protein